MLLICQAEVDIHKECKKFILDRIYLSLSLSFQVNYHHVYNRTKVGECLHHMNMWAILICFCVELIKSNKRYIQKNIWIHHIQISAVSCLSTLHDHYRYLWYKNLWIWGLSTHQRVFLPICHTFIATLLMLWLTDWLTDWLTHSLTHWMTDWLADWLTDWLAGWLTGWLADWLADWLAGWLIDWLTDQPTDWCLDHFFEWHTS